MRSRKKFKELRKLMYGDGIDQVYLAHYLNRSPGYIAQRMNGIRSWTLHDAYALCKLFNVPYEQVTTYFPPLDVSSMDEENEPVPNNIVAVTVMKPSR